MSSVALFSFFDLRSCRPTPFPYSSSLFNSFSFATVHGHYVCAVHSFFVASSLPHVFSLISQFFYFCCLFFLEFASLLLQYKSPIFCFLFCLCSLFCVLIWLVCCWFGYFFTLLFNKCSHWSTALLTLLLFLQVKFEKMQIKVDTNDKSKCIGSAYLQETYPTSRRISSYNSIPKRFKGKLHDIVHSYHSLPC